MTENVYTPFENGNIQIQSGYEIYKKYHESQKMINHKENINITSFNILTKKKKEDKNSEYPKLSFEYSVEDFLKQKSFVTENEGNAFGHDNPHNPHNPHPTPIGDGYVVIIYLFLFFVYKFTRSKLFKG